MSKTNPLPHGVCITVAYDGTKYHGWQFQPNAPDDRELPTIQGELERALDRMGIEHSAVRGCSRTDGGVHALGQVAAFGCGTEISPHGWIPALNQNLPDDIAISSAVPCFYRYNPRFHAIHKTYRYLLLTTEARNPLLTHRAWHVGWQRAINVERMRDASQHFVGTHDFRAFKGKGEHREQFERTMFDLRVIEEFGGDAGVVAVEVRGTAFLKNMVRIMVGTLVDIGQGRMEPDVVPDLLTATSDRTRAGQTAPAHGLYLVNVALDRVLGPADFFGQPT